MTTAGFQAHEARIAAFAVRQAQIRPDNKAALFDALEAAGVHSIVVAFDGSGHAGQIESVTALDGTNGELTLPDTMIAMQEVDFHGPSVALRHCSPNEVIEIMAYAFLEQTHDGWENGDGGQGEFTFDSRTGPSRSSTTSTPSRTRVIKRVLRRRQMAHRYQHAVSSACKWGGKPDDDLAVHSWMDGSKELVADFRHRAVSHHCEGLSLAGGLFGSSLRTRTGGSCPCGRSPSRT